MESSLMVLMPVLFVVPLISVVALVGFMAFMILYIQRGKYKPREQQELEQHLLNAVKQAELRSVEIIEDATKKAHKVLMDASESKKLIEAKLNKLVEDAMDSAQNQLDAQKGEVVEKFKGAYGRLIEQYEGETQTLIANLQHEAREMQQTFKTSLGEESMKILTQMKENSDRQITEANQQIKEYRERAFKKIDEQVEGLVKQYIQDYFTTEMPKGQHENMLLKALEKFKHSYQKPESTT